MTTEIKVAENSDDPLMREIEDELRQEQMQKFWKAYGSYIVGVAVAVVVVVAGYQGWTAYERSQHQTATDRLIGAAQLAEQNDLPAAIEAFGMIGNDGDGGFSTLASLRQAGLSAEQGDHAGAAQAYAKVAGDTGASKSLRDMATVLGVMQEFEAGSATAEDVLTRLEPLREANSKWRHTAREFSAIVAIKTGDKAKARELLEAIALDAEAPGGVRSRAEELLQAIGE